MKLPQLPHASAAFLTPVLSALCLCVAPALVACGDSGGKGAGTEQAGDEHDGHQHAPGEEHDHDHGGEEEGKSLGTVTAAGTKIEVLIHGELTPGEEAHLDIKALSGPDPANVRGWIGLESGTGSLKGKAEPEPGGYHLHAEAPAELTAEMKLWIEVERQDGTRESAGLPLE